MTHEAPKIEKTMMEKHFQTIVVTILLAVSGWVAVTTQGTSVQVATLQVKVEGLQERLDAGNIDRYRSADAARDLLLRDQRIDRLEDRIEALEDGSK